MKGLIFSDLHVYPYTQFARTLDDGMNSRLSEILDVLGRLVLRANEPDIDFVLVPGDVFNEKEKVNVRAFTETVILLSLIEKQTLFVTGNHDFVSKKEGTVQFSALSIMKNLGSHFYLDEEMVVGGVQKFIGVPCYDPRQVEEHYAVIRKHAHTDKDAVLVTHGEVKGAIDGKIVFSTGLPMSILQEFKASVVGHVHTPQFEGSVCLPGSPMHHDWGDVGRPAVAWEMTIQNTIQAPQVEFEPFEVDGPRFVDVPAEEYLTLRMEPHHYYRIIGEVEGRELTQNVIAIPKEIDFDGTGRGEVKLADSYEELIEKWLVFKGIKREDDVYADYLAFGKRCLG